MDLFKPFKDKILGDFKNQVVAMAKALDVDGNGIKDPQQALEDIEKIIAGGSDLVKLGMAYYIKFGPKEPVKQLASLKQENNVA